MDASRWLCLATFTSVLGCSDEALAPRHRSPDAALRAKGGPAPAPAAAFTITDVGLSLQSDGKGVYLDGVCGVGGWWDGVGGSFSPAGVKIPKSQQASCAGIAPRAATVTLALRHVSDDPHIDESLSVTSFGFGNVKWGTGGNGTTTINANNNGTPVCGTLGLRYTSLTYPGSSNTVREDRGGGLWHLYTLPWPDNKAYCENDGAVTFWHVSFDLYAQVKQ